MAVLLVPIHNTYDQKRRKDKLRRGGLLSRYRDKEKKSRALAGMGQWKWQEKDGGVIWPLLVSLEDDERVAVFHPVPCQ